LKVKLMPIQSPKQEGNPRVLQGIETITNANSCPDQDITCKDRQRSVIKKTFWN
jgi:hypothetical protein